MTWGRRIETKWNEMKYKACLCAAFFLCQNTHLINVASGKRVFLIIGNKDTFNSNWIRTHGCIQFESRIFGRNIQRRIVEYSSFQCIYTRMSQIMSYAWIESLFSIHFPFEFNNHCAFDLSYSFIHLHRNEWKVTRNKQGNVMSNFMLRFY